MSVKQVTINSKMVILLGYSMGVIDKINSFSARQKNDK